MPRKAHDSHERMKTDHHHFTNRFNWADTEEVLGPKPSLLSEKGSQSRPKFKFLPKLEPFIDLMVLEGLI